MSSATIMSKFLKSDVSGSSSHHKIKEANENDLSQKLEELPIFEGKKNLCLSVAREIKGCQLSKENFYILRPTIKEYSLIKCINIPNKPLPNDSTFTFDKIAKSENHIVFTRLSDRILHKYNIYFHISNPIKSNTLTSPIASSDITDLNIHFIDTITYINSLLCEFNGLDGKVKILNDLLKKYCDSLPRLEDLTDKLGIQVQDITENPDVSQLKNIFTLDFKDRQSLSKKLHTILILIQDTDKVLKRILPPFYEDNNKKYYIYIKYIFNLAGNNLVINNDVAEGTQSQGNLNETSANNNSMYECVTIEGTLSLDKEDLVCNLSEGLLHRLLFSFNHNNNNFPFLEALLKSDVDNASKKKVLDKLDENFVHDHKRYKARPLSENGLQVAAQQFLSSDLFSPSKNCYRG